MRLKSNALFISRVMIYLKEIISMVPAEAPIIFFCLDNTTFKAATKSQNALRKTTDTMSTVH
jgi:hypothetical protein